MYTDKLFVKSYEPGEWDICEIAWDGGEAVLNDVPFKTKAEAERVLQQWREEDAAIEGAERRYQEGYAYACGYYD